jgi:hypothetical protein
VKPTNAPRKPHFSRTERLYEKIENLWRDVNACLEQGLERDAGRGLDKIVATLKLPRFVREALGWAIVKKHVGDHEKTRSAEQSQIAYNQAYMVVHRSVEASDTNQTRREEAERKIARHLGSCAGRLFRAKELSAGSLLLAPCAVCGANAELLCDEQKHGEART